MEGGIECVMYIWCDNNNIYIMYNFSLVVGYIPHFGGGFILHRYYVNRGVVNSWYMSVGQIVICMYSSYSGSMLCIV